MVLQWGYNSLKGGEEMAQIKSYMTDEMKSDIEKYCNDRKISVSTFIKLAAYELFKKENYKRG